MRALFVGLSLVMSLACCVGCSSVKTLDVHPAASSDWRQTLADRLPLYGHRNWIVIADSAYPAQTRNGIETVVTGADQIEVVQAVLTALDHTRHVTPTVYTDSELKHVPENDAPGIDAYRTRLSQVLGTRPVTTIPHEQVIMKLDQAGEAFKVLILKTNLTLPYTSVFLELGCGYWTPEAEKRLRMAVHESGGR
jgi:L-fucose mutarotase/ribose pyranase (RbsD/FucU family)